MNCVKFRAIYISSPIDHYELLCCSKRKKRYYLWQKSNSIYKYAILQKKKKKKKIGVPKLGKNTLSINQACCLLFSFDCPYIFLHELLFHPQFKFYSKKKWMRAVSRRKWDKKEKEMLMTLNFPPPSACGLFWSSVIT